MKTILVTAYAVNPFKGSEDGMGWNMILQIARFNKVIAVTRENNKEKIEKFLSENHVDYSENIQFEYFDLPYFLRFWKKKSRGAMLYFYLWQIGLAIWAKSKKWNIDIAHNLNFHNDWTPTFLWLLGKPLVWGPIGHHPAIPIEFLKRFGWKLILKNRATWFLKKLFWNMDPFLFITKKKANIVFSMNSSVQKKLGFNQNKEIRLPSVGSEKKSDFYVQKKGRDFKVLSIGRFVPLKGFDVTIDSFSVFYNKLPADDQPFAQLILVGAGPLENQLKAQVKKLEIEHAVSFIPWLERDQLAQIYRKSKVFLFPSHEGAGMVVSEAFSHGLPVLSFKNCGPGEFVDESCGFTVPYQNYDKTIHDFSECLMRLYFDRMLLNELSSQAIIKHSNEFDWNVKGLVFKSVYENIFNPKQIHLNSTEKKYVEV